MKKNYLLSALLTFAGLSGMYSQCLMIESPLSDRVHSSAVIFEGRVLGKTSSWNAEHTNIYTKNTIEVYKVFKGASIASVAEVITPGGIVGSDMEVVNPGLELNPGEAGIFLLRQSEISVSALESWYGPQGFIKYDLTDGSASDVFHRYTDIQTEVYAAIANQTGRSYISLKAFSIQDIKLRTSSLPPTISGFTPTTITAGTRSILTINGTNFGTKTGSAQVRFKNADDGGASYNVAADSNIVSWTATQIQVLVPSKCGTGTIQVADNTGASVTSSSTLTVPYGQLTAVSAGKENRIELANKNTKGGYNLKYCTAFSSNSNAVASFERALQTWRCGTFLNFRMLSASTANVCNVNDTNNIVNFDGGCVLGGSTIGICNSYYSGCTTGGITYWTLSGIDLRFAAATNWNYGPAATSGGKIDFETVALHELGHAHGLAHLIDPPQVMHWQRNTNQDVRTLSTGSDIAGGNDMITRSTGSNNPCGATAHTALNSGNCILTGIKENTLQEETRIYPNPFSNSAILHIAPSALQAGNEITFVLFDVLGNKVKATAGITTENYTITRDNLSGGIYFYQIKNGEKVIATGKVILSGDK